MPVKLDIKKYPPSPQDFIDLRKSEDWGEITHGSVSTRTTKLSDLAVLLGTVF